MKKETYITLDSIYSSIIIDDINEKNDALIEYIKHLSAISTISGDDVNEYIVIYDIINSKIFKLLIEESEYEYSTKFSVLYFHNMIIHGEVMTSKSIATIAKNYNTIFDGIYSEMDDTDYDVTTRALLEAMSVSEDKKIATPALLKLTKLKRLNVKDNQSDNQGDVCDDSSLFGGSPIGGIFNDNVYNGKYHKSGKSWC